MLDNFSRAPREPASRCSGRVRLVEGDVRDRTTSPARWTAWASCFIRRRSASRSAPRSRGSRRTCSSTARSTCSRRRSAPASAGRRGVVRVGVRPGREFPTAETHHPYANRTIYGAAKMFNEALLRSFNDMYGLDYVALRYFNVYGPRMDIYGAYTEVLIRWMEAIAAGQAAGDLRRRQRRRWTSCTSRTSRARTCSRPRRRRHRRGVQRRHRTRDVAERAGATCCCRSWARRSRPEHAAAAQGEPGVAAAGLRGGGARAARVPRDASSLEEGLRAWWPGGSANAAVQP